MTTETTHTSTGADSQTGERADLLETLGRHRFFLRFTTRDLDDEQAARPDPVSGLSLGGLVKHVTRVEHGWAEFAQGRPQAMSGELDADPDAAHADSFRMQPGETLAGLLERYEEVAGRTDALVRTLDLDARHPLPSAPWFPPGATWSVRRVLLHVLAETAQHAGHADAVREGIDGSKTMG